jgi:hypothetical protein
MQQLEPVLHLITCELISKCGWWIDLLHNWFWSDINSIKPSMFYFRWRRFTCRFIDCIVLNCVVLFCLIWSELYLGEQLCGFYNSFNTLVLFVVLFSFVWWCFDADGNGAKLQFSNLTGFNVKDIHYFEIFNWPNRRNKDDTRWFVANILLNCSLV